MFWEKVGRVYDNVEAALCATLLALVVYSTVVIPKMHEIGAQNERVRVQEIAAETALYCEKFGMNVGTQKYNQCLLDLGEFRMKLEKRIYDQSVF